MIWDLLAFLCLVYIILLLGRVVVEWVQVFSREWRPKGVVLVVVEAIYTVTDPPLRFLRRVIPPLSLGPIRLDLAFLVLIVALSFLMRLFNVLAAL